jgi:hypothetical protein
MLPELTPEQIAAQDVYGGDKFVQLGLSTDPIDRSLLPDFRAFMAECLDEAPVQDYVFCDGPQHAWNEVKSVYGVKGPLPFDAAGFQGSTDAPLIAWGRYVQEVLGTDLSGTGFDEFCHVSEGLHYVWVTEKKLIFCERPYVLTLDDMGELHNEAGPCLAYHDGHKAWFIHGVKVDEKIVLRPQSQTISEIKRDTDNDRRSIRIRRYGWPRYLTQVEAKVLHEIEDDVQGTLNVLYSTGDDYNVLLSVDPASDLVALPVPSTCRDYQAAKVWLNGGNEYNIIGRT